MAVNAILVPLSPQMGVSSACCADLDLLETFRVSVEGFLALLRGCLVSHFVIGWAIIFFSIPSSGGR